MKRFALVLLFLLACLLGGVYAMRDRVAESLMRHGIERLTVLAGQRGMRLSNVTFRQATLAGFGTISARELEGQLLIQQGLMGPAPEFLHFEAPQIALTMEDLWRGRVVITVIGGFVEVLNGGGLPSGQQLSDLRIEADLSVSWRRPVDSVRVFEHELRRLVRDGEFGVPARISAVARFQVVGQWHEVTVRSLAADGSTRLYLEREDVRRMAQAYVLPLTEAEVELVASFPVRAPALLRLGHQAFSAAQAMKTREPGYPYDAYRHVYWSWLLTRAFGPEFSERVTDAHEIRPTYEVSEASRRMDLHNNAVGRALALAGVPEHELVQRVRTDPNIVRSER
jgi:hypothetical protein